MDQSLANVGATAAPAWRPKGIVGWLYSSNPFYVISANLVFIGLRLSFQTGSKSFDIRALMFGLAGYTLLLATTAVLLIRFGRVWQDVRTILLLVLLMFLATSVAIDDTLIARPSVGSAYFVGALVFAAVVSESVLRGARLRLPAAYRVPYYLILALFFLYPVALSPWLKAPDSAAMHWGLFAFSPLAGLVFLTLLPAIRRGPRYLANNGSPWRWPLYPWVLFGFLALGVCGRAYYLCISLHNVRAFENIFGPYFLVPFLFSLNVLYLEAGLVRRNRLVQRTALGVPFILAWVASVGHRPDTVYQHFLDMVYYDLGGSPLFLALMAVTAFQIYAIVRGASGALETLTASLAALAVVEPISLTLSDAVAPQALPILAMGLIQLGLWLREGTSGRALVAFGCLAASPTIALAQYGYLPGRWGGIVAFHVALLVVLFVGAVCDDALGRALRNIGAAVMVVAALTVAMDSSQIATKFDPDRLAAKLPPELISAYPLMVALASLVYATLVGHRLSLWGSTICMAGWTLATASQGYKDLRRSVVGLDEIALGLAFFVVAALISLGKAGLLAKWIEKLQASKPPPGAES